MKKVIIFGTGKIAEVAFYYIQQNKEYDIVCFTVESEYIKESLKFGKPIVPYETIETVYPPNQYFFFAPCGGDKLNKFRERIYNTSKALGYKFISYISPDAKVCTDNIGENTFILENNVIQPYTKIGNNCIIWSGNHIGHHSTIEDHVFLTSHIVISGMCTIGEYSYIGVNTSIKDNTIVAKNTVIGMGSLINKNTESYNIYIGSPAKILKPCDDTIKL
jgi:sugar O-acyltransferase (sialic acid O-acetyltransferase NeuD family)